MRIHFILASVMLSTTLMLSCGTSDDGNSGSGSPGGDLPLSPADCETAWTNYVASHPKGLMLRYENRAMGHISQNTIEVTESSNSAVTETHRVGRETSSTTTTKSEWMENCKSGAGAPQNTPVNGTIESQRKEIKTTRAGTFNTNYIKFKTTQTMGDTTAVTVTESWTNDETNAAFTVYSKSVITTDTQTMESTTELIAIVRP